MEPWCWPVDTRGNASIETHNNGGVQFRCATKKKERSFRFHKGQQPCEGHTKSWLQPASIPPSLYPYLNGLAQSRCQTESLCLPLPRALRSKIVREWVKTLMKTFSVFSFTRLRPTAPVCRGCFIPCNTLTKLKWKVKIIIYLLSLARQTENYFRANKIPKPVFNVKYHSYVNRENSIYELFYILLGHRPSYNFSSVWHDTGRNYNVLTKLETFVCVF